MITVTWRDLVGSEYGPDMTQPVNLSHLHVPPICTKCTSMGSVLTAGLAKGGERTTKGIQFYGQGAVTAHNVGAGMDIFYDTGSGSQKAFGNALVELFIRYRLSLGWGWMAYNHIEFNQTGMGVPDAPHVDHIHIDWVDGARTEHSHLLTSFTWFDGHKVQTKNVGSYGQDVAMTTKAAADLPVPSDFVAAYDQLCTTWSANRVAFYKDYTRRSFDDAYAGVAAGEDLGWLLGWWEVWDGNYYYYYFDDGGRVVYIETRPSGPSAAAPAYPHNKGSYAFNAGHLVCHWNPLQGLAATVETFYNAHAGATQMNANSSNYSPLVATRLR